LPKDGSIPPTSLHGQSGDVRIKPSLGKRTSNEICNCNARAAEDAVKAAILDEKNTVTTDQILHRLEERLEMQEAFANTKAR
jgi:hypothetical protein